MVDLTPLVTVWWDPHVNIFYIKNPPTPSLPHRPNSISSHVFFFASPLSSPPRRCAPVAVVTPRPRPLPSTPTAGDGPARATEAACVRRRCSSARLRSRTPSGVAAPLLAVPLLLCPMPPPPCPLLLLHHRRKQTAGSGLMEQKGAGWSKRSDLAVPLLLLQPARHWERRAPEKRKKNSAGEREKRRWREDGVEVGCPCPRFFVG